MSSPNWIVMLELEWPALPGEQDAERAFNRLRPALEALRMTMSVLHDSAPHWHRLTTPRLEGEPTQETLDPVADELLKSPMPPR
mgnify:FL=1